MTTPHWKLIEEIIEVLQQNLLNAIVIAVLASMAAIPGDRTGFVKKWIRCWRKREFRRHFFLLIYLSVLSSITLLTRDYQPNPFREVIGKWFLKYRSGLWHHGNIENILLFLPLCPLVIMNIKRGHKYSIIGLLWRGIILSLGATLLIEILQAVFHRGTFQLSDLFFNTIGGLIGLLFYMAVREIRRRRHG